ncbi:MAG: helix-turn-helix domain-containing protein [Rikenellaceae bacterium]
MNSQKVITLKLIKEVDFLIKQVDTILDEYKPYFGGEHYLTDSELTKILSVNRATLHEWRVSGRLAFYRIGGKILYKQSDIEDMMNKHYYPAFMDSY